MKLTALMSEHSKVTIVILNSEAEKVIHLPRIYPLKVLVNDSNFYFDFMKTEFPHSICLIITDFDNSDILVGGCVTLQCDIIGDR